MSLDDPTIMDLYRAVMRGELTPEEAAERMAAKEKKYLLTITLRTLGLGGMTVFCAWLMVKLLEAQR